MATQGHPEAAVPLLSHLRKLSSHSLVYGAADVFSNVTNLLLTPVYTTFLLPTDYRDIGILVLFAAVTKILFRLGLDAGFFRVYYDLGREEARRLAGSVALFAAAVGTLLFLLVVAFVRPLSIGLLGPGTPRSFLVLAAADIYFATFAFVPGHLLRIQDRPGLYSKLSIGRHGVNTILKVLLLVNGYGVAGVLWSDMIASFGFAAATLPILVRHASFRWSWPLVREALAFGLPKVPHGLMVQVQNLADRKLLDLFVAASQVGIYHVAYTLATGVKFALSAFEPAWGPFVFSKVKRPEAPQLLASVATYAFSAFVATGLVVATLAREILTLLTPANPEYREAAPVIPVVVLAYVLHGTYLLGSVGIGIKKRTRYYPLITAASATTNVIANLQLIPRAGIMGAAWATVLSYSVMAGLGVWLSYRLYPIPFETGRLSRVTLAALLTYLLSWLAPTALWPAIAVKALCLLAFPALIALSGALRPGEWAFLEEGVGWLVRRPRR
jgi:O-antigen/teichoic acid export membrane protein